ncbi:HAD-IIIA family hydrolase [Vibrio cholerae]|uniref:KdsC family phosphatase n=1 Tax=Vibrio cholerae TaxID=666 RepID=UPI001159A30B|nr:HAD-IIIA family hydrolase [Vibrio cholerae]EJL6409457.1 HAD-IIIA family hydrolase [Vibrio cholerae]EJL6710262.1 HAD-IIIA family hydrolase [Vibrio cholerae]EJL9428300.1 HAD-IIIA family hydrolase [Vibrio cholerae]EKF9879058.1 HAD-IIIA family hydrolase [Vibrio cholerae]TQO58504.1 HAD-IIIA family hydrolase [Vibrio cholerae]
MPILLNKPIKLVMFDVDGVMTDGTIYISEQGEIFKSFNVKDGLAIELLRVHGIKTGIISGKSSPALAQRCSQLGIDLIEMGHKNKLPVLESICRTYGYQFDEVAFCGDDVLDIPVMKRCGLSAAPSDAHDLVIECANWVSTKLGGFGMIREFVDDLLMVQLQASMTEIYTPLMKKISENQVNSLEQ